MVDLLIEIFSCEKFFVITFAFLVHHNLQCSSRKYVGNSISNALRCNHFFNPVKSTLNKDDKGGYQINNNSDSYRYPTAFCQIDG